MQFLFNMVVLAIGVIGAVVPWVIRSHRSPLLDAVPAVVVPPLATTAAFAMSGGYRLGRLLVVRDSGYVVTSYGEVTELCLAIAFASHALFALARVRQNDGFPSLVRVATP